MANFDRVTKNVCTGGDLPFHLGPIAMLAALKQFRAAGITHIIDNRLECSDEDFVAAHAPEISYLWNGQDDVGQTMPDSWFDDGVEFALQAIADDPDARVLAHCHMGINRGPSMAFAILLALGMDPVAALTAIRSGRPIAAIYYAGDALSWWHRATGTPAGDARRQRVEVAAWHRAYPIDVVHIIGAIRREEDDARPLSA